MIPADKIAEMNNIMTHVVTEGTGRAAQIPGLTISGKTGTTNNSTNAWFNAFTGNLVGSVWFGNDDNSPTENMTGGTLPAQSWREIMVYAHEGLEPKPPYGVAPAAPSANSQSVEATQAKSGSGAPEGAPREVGLAPRSTEVILEIGDFARNARKRSAALESSSSPSDQASASPSDKGAAVLAP